MSFMSIPEVFANKDIDCMAKNIYFEARNQSFVGQVAVAWVVHNRVNSKKYPDSYCQVVYQGEHFKAHPVRHRCKFSWYCDGKPDEIKNYKAYAKAIEVAKTYKTFQDPTFGSLYYHNTKVKPYWAEVFNKKTKIGEHIFYEPN